MFRFTAIAFAAIAGLSFCAPAARADLIVNGGFETGDFTGFNVNATFTGVQTSGFNGLSAHSGSYFAVLGDASSTFGSIDQTVVDTPGDVLTLSYWLASDGLTPNFFASYWNGSPLSGGTLNNAGAFPYTQFQFAVNATGIDTLVFLEQNARGFFSLDDVSLTPQQSTGPGMPGSGVPTPSSLLLVASGLALWQMSRWLRNIRI